MHTRHEYARQAETYDTTRAASPSVLVPLRAALGGLPGPRLLDVGGGTGNYAVDLRTAGLEPTVVDYSRDMLRVAASKGLPTVRGDAALLPFADATVDAVMLVSMLHHVPDGAQALHEARRVVRPGGRVALLVFAREHLDVHWVTRYFPRTTAHFREGHQTLAELTEALPGATQTPVFYEDLVDNSMAAMCRRPFTLLDPDIRRQTSFFERAGRDDPAELRDGLARLERDIEGGMHPERDDPERRRRLGDALLLTWTAP